MFSLNLQTTWKWESLRKEIIKYKTSSWYTCTFNIIIYYSGFKPNQLFHLNKIQKSDRSRRTLPHLDCWLPTNTALRHRTAPRCA